METAFWVVAAAQLLVGVGGTAWLALKWAPLKRAQRRTDIATQAVAYAEQLGGDGPSKLRHAMDAARQLDLADNGKRDYADNELRIAIEAVVNQKGKSW